MYKRQPKKDALDAPVAYEANDSIVFTQSGFAHLCGQGQVSYPGADLEADVISMDMDNLSLIHIFMSFMRERSFPHDAQSATSASE